MLDSRQWAICHWNQMSRVHHRSQSQNVLASNECNFWSGKSFQRWRSRTSFVVPSQTNERTNSFVSFQIFPTKSFSVLHPICITGLPTYLPTSVTRKNRQMSINVAQNDFTRKMIDLQKFPKNVGDLGKLIVVTGLWKVAQSGHTATYVCCNSNQKMEMSLGIFFPEVRFIKNRRIS